MGQRDVSRSPSAGVQNGRASFGRHRTALSALRQVSRPPCDRHRTARPATLRSHPRDRHMGPEIALLGLVQTRRDQPLRPARPGARWWPEKAPAGRTATPACAVATGSGPPASTAPPDIGLPHQRRRSPPPRPSPRLPRKTSVTCSDSARTGRSAGSISSSAPHAASPSRIGSGRSRATNSRCLFPRRHGAKLGGKYARLNTASQLFCEIRRTTLVVAEQLAQHVHRHQRRAFADVGAVAGDHRLAGDHRPVGGAAR